MLVFFNASIFAQLNIDTTDNSPSLELSIQKSNKTESNANAMRIAGMVFIGVGGIGHLINSELSIYSINNTRFIYNPRILGNFSWASIIIGSFVMVSAEIKSSKNTVKMEVTPNRMIINF